MNAPFLTEGSWEGGQKPEACGQSAGLGGWVCPAFQLASSHAVSAPVCPKGLVVLSL